MGGFALYSHTKIVKFRESAPRVISLTAAGSNNAPELQPLKGSATGDKV